MTTTMTTVYRWTAASSMPTSRHPPPRRSLSVPMAIAFTADHHRLTFLRLGELVGGRWANAAGYLQHCRVRRNTSLYDLARSGSAAGTRDLRLQAEQPLTEGRNWLRTHRPALLP